MIQVPALFLGLKAGIAQLVEHQPSKLRVAGSSLVSRSMSFKLTMLGFFYSNSLVAHVAQVVEHFLGKEEVTGSSPVVGSSFSRFGANGSGLG